MPLSSAWLHVTNPFYKYLVKNDVTKMRNILIQVQKYIQIEEVTRAASGHPPRPDPEVEKPKPQFPLRNSPNYNSFAIHKPARCATEPSKGSEAESNHVLFKVPIDHIFNIITDQPWVRRPTRPLSPNLRGPGSNDYCAFHEGRPPHGGFLNPRMTPVGFNQ